MTEADWLACGYPTGMLSFVHDRASTRRLRLFAVACCRRIKPYITDPGSWRMVEIAELAADGGANPFELLSLDFDRLTDDGGGVDEPYQTAPYRTAFMVAGHVCYSLVAPLHTSTNSLSAFADALGTMDGAEEVMAESYEWPDDPMARHYPSDVLLAEYERQETEAQIARRELRSTERRAQADLIRDIFGNPFRPVALDSSWRTEAVVALARGVYDDRAFDRLPVLADALDDAGCANADLLDHLRGSGPHVRGCWAVDLLLGKE